MRPHVVLVTREVWPFVLGGGIGRAVRDLATALTEIADVTVLTQAGHREAHDRMLASGDAAWFADERITFGWIAEPSGDLSPFWSYDHAWSARCHAALRSLALERPIDLIEFPDYLGSAAVTLNARRAGDKLLASVPVVVRLHTTWEITQALDSRTTADLASRTIIALERIGLRFADRLCAPGEETGAAVRRAYGDQALAPMLVVPMPFDVPAPDPAAERAPAGEVLRLLFIGRLEHRKGVERLVRAVMSLESEHVTLTLVGGDTQTAPGQTSMRAYLQRLADGDERVQLRDFVPPEQVPALIRDHHVVVVPSLFESFGYVVREANAQNRPVLGTPVGGLVDGIEEGRNGWLTADTSEGAIALTLADLVSRREHVERLIGDGAPRAAVETAGDRAALLEAYGELLAAAAPGAGPAGDGDGAPEVTAIVTAVERDGVLGETLASLDAQRTPCSCVIVACDDPLRVDPASVGSLTGLLLVESGEDAEQRARQAALERADPSHAVLLLRAGDLLDPDFVRRALAALDAAAAPAYVTTFARGRFAGRAPIGNATAALVPEHDSSGSVGLFAPGVLSALPAPVEPGRMDSAMYAELAAGGMLGAVIPEPLVFRVQRGSRLTAGPPATPGLASGPAVWERREA